jgi:hypothetical protein
MNPLRNPTEPLRDGVEADVEPPYPATHRQIVASLIHFRFNQICNHFCEI